MAGRTGGRTVAIRLTLEETERVRAGLLAIKEDGVSALKALEDGSARASATMQKLGPVANDTGSSLDSMKSRLAGVGLQLQDVAVQAASGTSALTILGQQGPQIASVFGPAGAIVGAGIAIAALAGGLALAALNGKGLTASMKEMDEAGKLADEAAQRRVNGYEEEARRLNALAAAYQTYTAAALAGERARLTIERDNQARDARREVSSLDSTSFGLSSVRQAVTAADFAGGDVATAGERAALEQFSTLNDVASITRERLLAVAGALDEASRAGGPFASALAGVRDNLIGQLGPLTEAGEKARYNAENLRLIEQASGGASQGVTAVGASAQGTAGQVQALNSGLDATRQRLLALAQARVANPFEEVDASIARIQAQRDALERGGIEAFEQEKRRQTAQAQIASRVEQDVARQAEALKRNYVEGEEATRRLNEVREEATRRRTKEANDEAALENAAAARRNAEAEGRRAATAGRTAARKEEADAERQARQDDQLRVQVLGAKADAEYRYEQFVAKADDALRRGVVTQEQHSAALERNNPLTIEATRLLDQIRTPAEKYADQLERMRILLEAGKLTQEQFNAAVEKFDPAVKAAEEAAKKQQTAIETANRQVTDSIVRYSADTFADLFDKNSKGWRGMLDTFLSTFRRTMARIAAEAVIRPLVQPIVQAAGLGGTFGSGLAVSGGGGMLGQGGVTTAGTDGSGGGSVMGYAQQAGQAYSAYGKLSGMNPTNYINGTTPFNTGWSGADSVLNTPIMGGTYGTTEALGAGVNASGYVPGTALSGEAGAFAGGGGAVSPGLTYGGAAMGALGVAGGAYAAYQGIQRGGPGGYTSAAGGAATAGLSAAAMAGMAVPVYGWIAAAALMVIGALLPGQKPSDMTGTYTLRTGTGEGEEGGLTGKRFSQANRDQAQSIAEALGKIADNMGKAAGLPGAVDEKFRVEAGSRDGITVNIGEWKAQGEANEEGIKAITDAFSRKLLEAAGRQAPDANVRAVIANSGGDVDTTMANLDWYENTYKALTDTLDRTTSWAQALVALNKPWDDAIEKAAALGLATQGLADKQALAAATAEKARNDAFNAELFGMQVQTAQLQGGNLTGIALDQFDRNRSSQWDQMVASIRDRGLGDVQINDARTVFDALQDIQRQGTERQYRRAYEDSQASVAGLIAADQARGLRLGGDTVGAEVVEYRAQRSEAETAYARQLEDLRFSTETAADMLSRFAAETEAGAAQIVKAAEEQAAATAAATAAQEAATAAAQRDSAAGNAGGVVGSLAEYARSLRTSDAAAGTVLDRYAAAQSAFDATAAKASGGDFDAILRVQSDAETLRGLSREVNGGGAGYAQTIGRIEQVLGSIADLGSDRLTDGALRNEVRGQTAELGGKLDDLRTEIANLRRDQALWNAMPR